MQIQYFGRFLDVLENEKISYVMQVQDLADVSSVNSSVTTSFKLPKTLNNLETLKYLSLPSDTSNIPYIQNTCRLYDNGTILINSAWLKIISSDSTYFNVNIENGIIDFFKAIENKTIGKDLDLSETEHNKDLVSVIDSFERNDYTYIVADYNGLNTYFKTNTEYINTDYLVPSLNNKYIWDKIFNTFGYTYEGSVFTTDDFTNLWITYPKSVPVQRDDEELPEPVERFKSSSTSPIIKSSDSDYIINIELENIVSNNVTILNDVLTIELNGTYQIRQNIIGQAVYYKLDNWGGQDGYHYENLYLGVKHNGVNIERNGNFNINLRQGDTLEFYIWFNEWNDSYSGGLFGVTFNGYDIKLLQVSQALIDFNNEFLDLSVSDYIKEIMIRFSLTPFIDVENKHIKFLTLNERLQNSKLIDWSDKYIERVNETYTYKDYAINNYLKHKYNDENAVFNNGNLFVNNLNLEKEKDLYQSKIYSYNREITKFYEPNPIENNSFPIWDREIKETIDNDTNVKTYEVNYKGLENRFYFIRRKYLEDTINIGTQLLNINEVVDKIAVPETKGLSYAEIIANRYNNFSKVLTDTRIHEINVYLTINDLLNLDLEALYYFNQENQYYILNRITIDLDTKVSKGEFIRVKYK